jgi:hypothetical protein
VPEIVRLEVELPPEVFVGVVPPLTEPEPPHAFNRRSHERTVIKAAEWGKKVEFAYSFCAEQGKRDNIYPPLQKGFVGHSAGGSFELEFIQLGTSHQITNSQKEVPGVASTQLFADVQEAAFPHKKQTSGNADRRQSPRATGFKCERYSENSIAGISFDSKTKRGAFRRGTGDGVRN